MYQKKVDWDKYLNRHSSKSIWVIKLSFCQNDSFITHILFELCLFSNLAQSTFFGTHFMSSMHGTSQLSTPWPKWPCVKMMMKNFASWNNFALCISIFVNPKRIELGKDNLFGLIGRVRISVTINVFLLTYFRNVRLNYDFIFQRVFLKIIM